MTKIQRPWEGKEQEMIQAYRDDVRLQEIVSRFAITRKTLYAILRSAGVDLRGSPESRKYDHEQVIADYLAGMTLKEIAKKHGMPYVQTVAPILNKAGISQVRATGSKPLSMKPWNPSFFERRDTETAYWCGFLMADGSLKHKGGWGLSLSLHERDIEHIYAYCDAIGLDRTRVGQYESRYKSTISVMKDASVYYHELPDLLLPWGIVPNKTHVFVEPQIPNAVLPDYLRGYFDGNGSMVVTKKSRVFGVTGNYKMLEWYAAALQRVGFDANVSLKYAKNDWGRLYVHGLQSMQVLAVLLRADTLPRLDRKWAKLQE